MKKKKKKSFITKYLNQQTHTKPHKQIMHQNTFSRVDYVSPSTHKNDKTKQVIITNMCDFCELTVKIPTKLASHTHDKSFVFVYISYTDVLEFMGNKSFC